MTSSAAPPPELSVFGFVLLIVLGLGIFFKVAAIELLPPIDGRGALRGSPRPFCLDPVGEELGLAPAVADLFLDRLELALDRLRKSVEINATVAPTQFFLAAASALSGRAAEARDAGLRLDPNFTVARFLNQPRSENPTFLAQRQRIDQGLSLAGGAREGQVAVGTSKQ